MSTKPIIDEVGRRALTSKLKVDDGINALAAKIAEAHQQTIESARASVESAVKCGDWLIQAKIIVDHGGHGSWIKWIGDHFSFTVRTAQSYMSLARKFKMMDPDAKRAAYLTPLRKLLRDLSDPERRKKVEKKDEKLLNQEVIDATETRPVSPAFSKFWQLVEDCVDAELSAILDAARNGGSEHCGKAKRHLNPYDLFDLGPITDRYGGGGFKTLFPELSRFRESPSEIARAVEKKSGNFYESLREAVREQILDAATAAITGSDPAILDVPESFEQPPPSASSAETSSALQH